MTSASRFVATAALVFMTTRASSQNDSISVQRSVQMAMDAMSGMVDLDNRTVLEGDGYMIVLDHHKWPPSQKAFEKTRKKVSPKAKVIATDRDDLPKPNMVCDRTLMDGLGAERFYYYATGIEGYMVVGFTTAIRDEAFEKAVFDKILSGGNFNDDLVNSPAANEIDFCGRRIDLGPACQWMAPHNCQCRGLGQMNWSVVTSAQRAKELVDAQMHRTMQARHELAMDTVDVLLEGVEAQAIKLYYKIPTAIQVLAQTPHELIAYYVNATIRGRHVFCVMSYYEDEAPKGELPLFLSEVMKLKE